MKGDRLLSGLRRGAWYERVAALLQRRVSYSQFGEDVHIRALYDRLRFDRQITVAAGLIVDVGSYRPIFLSNSYAFYRQGWRSINIDPTPGSKRLFDAVRPRDVNLEIAIGRTEGTSRFFVFGEPSVWNTMDPEAAALAEAKTGRKPIVRDVPVLRLETVLRQHPVDLPFEMLSIDAEGHDLEILDSVNLAVNRPRIVLVETHEVTAETIAAHPIVQWMRQHDYRLHSWINPNFLFLRNDSALGETR